MIRNYLNYIGSKDRYLEKIMPYLERASKDKGCRTLVDLFCGSAVVGVNALDLFDSVVCNDRCRELISIHRWVRNRSKVELFEQIDSVISQYGLNKQNKEGFLKLRKDYNSKLDLNPCQLFTLVTHSFNYSLHTNSKGEFNAPFGANRSCFNNSLRKRLGEFKSALDKHSNNILFNSLDFEQGIEFSGVKDTVYFVDPPYSASKSKQPYRVKGVTWNEKEDARLFDNLDYIHNSGGCFVLTDVISNNGCENVVLKEWSQKYNIEDVDVSYDNASYQRKNRGKTREVIVSNF